MNGNPRNVSLEPAAQEFVDATADPPYLYNLGPEEGRKAVDAVQDTPIFKPDVDEKWITVAGGPTGRVKVRIVKPTLMTHSNSADRRGSRRYANTNGPCQRRQRARAGAPIRNSPGHGMGEETGVAVRTARNLTGAR